MQLFFLLFGHNPLPDGTGYCKRENVGNGQDGGAASEKDFKSQGPKECSKLGFTLGHHSSLLEIWQGRVEVILVRLGRGDI